MATCSDSMLIAAGFTPLVPQITLKMKYVHAQVVDDYSSKSFRLLAGALGSISHVHKKQLPRMTQQQVEACATDMQLLSLIVLTNSVRQDSRDTISQLQDG